MSADLPDLTGCAISLQQLVKHPEPTVGNLAQLSVSAKERVRSGGKSITYLTEISHWIAEEGRLKVLSNLAAESQVTCAMIEDAARELGLQRSQCYELLRRYKSSPTVTALLQRVRGRAHGAKMLDGRVELVIEKAITEVYVEKKRSTLADLVSEPARLGAQEGISAPSYNAIARRLLSRDQVEVLRRRSGARQARNKLGRIARRGHARRRLPTPNPSPAMMRMMSVR